MAEPNWPQVLDEALDAVRAAGEIILDHWKRPRTIRHKGAIDLVTETDVAVESALKDSLRRVLPEASFLAEESSADAPLDELTWIIDPVDGTTNFAHGVPVLATSVGLWHRDRIRLGIIHTPLLGECFWALSGHGAFCNGERLRVTETPVLADSLVATGFPYAIREQLEPTLARIGKALCATRGVRRCGAAAVDLAWTAAGRYDGFWEAELNPWDVAAGWLLVEEAGGRVTQYDHAAPYALRARTILASNGLVHEELSRLITAVEE